MHLKKINTCFFFMSKPIFLDLHVCDVQMSHLLSSTLQTDLNANIYFHTLVYMRKQTQMCKNMHTIFPDINIHSLSFPATASCYIWCVVTPARQRAFRDQLQHDITGSGRKGEVTRSFGIANMSL